MALVLAMGLAGAGPGRGADGMEAAKEALGMLGMGEYVPEIVDAGVDPDEVPDLAKDVVEEAQDGPREGLGGGPLLKSGRASWYGPRFHGRRTANGEIYDQEALTCAMTGVPLGIRVRVVRTDTGASLVLRVNDRGPYERQGGRWVPHPTRVIDLSARAMRELGGLGAGIIPVRVYRAD